MSHGAAGSRTGGQLGIWGFATAIAVVMAGALALAAPASAKIIVHKLDSGAGSRVRSAAIERAKPMPLRTLPRSAASASRSAAAASAHGNPGYVAGHAPTGGAVAEGVARADAEASGFGKFSSQAVSDPTVYPATTNGKLVGKIPGVGVYSCSASVVHGKNHSTLFTAGHCVKDPEAGYATKLQFAPAYDGGRHRSASGTPSEVLVQKRWARRASNNYDYAAIVLKKLGGQTVEDVAGSKGFAYNINVKKKNYTAVGYPFNKGKTLDMWECSYPFGGSDPGYRKPGPKPFGIGCDMTEGASGGGWTIPGGFLSSVTSFGYRGLTNHLYGPRFDKKADRMRKAAGRVKFRR